jgi:hypothetical protein
VLQEELDKEKDIQKGYKHNVESKQKIKVFIKTIRDEDEKLKSSIAQLKLQEELQDLKQKAKI